MKYLGVFFLLLCCACTDKMNPLGVSNDKPSPNVGSNNNSNPTINRAVGDPPQLGCSILNITARRVLSVQDGIVVLRVHANYSGDGTPYVRIIDRDTGVPLGDYLLGDITLFLPPDSYNLRIFVEVSDSTGFYQCDGGLEFEVSIPRLPPPPPPPECEGEECDPPICDTNEFTVVYQLSNGDVVPSCIPPSPVCLSPLPGTGIRGPFPQQGLPTAECSFLGDFVPTEGPATFHVCKSSTNIFFSNLPFIGDTCRGDDPHEISHLTRCTCPVVN